MVSNVTQAELGKEQMRQHFRSRENQGKEVLVCFSRELSLKFGVEGGKEMASFLSQQAHFKSVWGDDR